MLTSKKDVFLYAITYINSLFVSEGFKKAPVWLNIPKDRFSKAKEYDQIMIWKYNYSDLKINNLIKREITKKIIQE